MTRPWLGIAQPSAALNHANREARAPLGLTMKVLD